MNETEAVNVTEPPNGFIEFSSATMLTFAAIMTILIMIIGIIGNFLTVAALIKCPKVRNVAAAFIMSLCVADLLFCALVLPFSAHRFIQGVWTPGEFLCRMIPFIQYGNIGVSLLCIAMITINRYVMIAHYSIYGRIYRRHWIAAMIIFCWVFSYGMQLPTLMGVWGTFGYDPKLGTCSIMTDSQGRSSKTALFITAFVIPCIIIIACYAKIFWVVHRSEQRLKRHTKHQNSIPNNLRVLPLSNSENGRGSGVSDINNLPDHFTNTNGRNAINRSSSIDSSSCSHELKPSISLQTQQLNTSSITNVPTSSRNDQQREVRAKRNEWRITKMVLAIFLSFVVCYLPITIAKVADQDVNYPNSHLLSYIMLYLSACLNPIIYVIMNKQYRKAYRTVLRCQHPLDVLGSIQCCAKYYHRKHCKSNKSNHCRHSQRPSGYDDADIEDGPDGVLRLSGKEATNSRRRDSGYNAAEKWKDASLSLSRTVISQVSMTESLPTTSCSRSPSPVKSNTVGIVNGLDNLTTTSERTSKTITTTTKTATTTTTTTTLKTMGTDAKTFVEPYQEPTMSTVITTPAILSHNNDLWKMSSGALAIGNWSGSPRLLMVRSPKETNRIALVGGDIILEEEDEEEEEEQDEIVRDQEKEVENETAINSVLCKAKEKNSKKKEDFINQRIIDYKQMTNGESKKIAPRPRSEFNVPEKVSSTFCNRKPNAPPPVYVNASALQAMKIATNHDKNSN